MANPIRQAVFVLIFGMLAVALQSSFVPALIPTFLVPNLVVLLAVFVGFYFPSVFGSLLSFTLGLELDAASGRMIGPWAGAAVVAFGTLAALAQRLFVESAFAVFVAVVIMAVVADVVYLILSGTPPDSFAVFLWNTLGGGVTAGVLAIPLFPILRRLVFGQDRGRYSRHRRW